MRPVLANDHCNGKTEFQLHSRKREDSYRNSGFRSTFPKYVYQLALQTEAVI